MQALVGFRRYKLVGYRGSGPVGFSRHRFGWDHPLIRLMGALLRNHCCVVEG